jgi:serine/threonine protein kinase
VYRGSCFGPKCDIWALGVLAFILFTGQEPFQGKNAKELYYQMQFRTDHFRLEWWNDVSPTAKAFVQTLLQFDETKRPTAQEALNHPWFDTILESSSSQSTTDTTNDTRKCPQPMSSWHHNLLRFSAQQTLKQATYAYLCSSHAKR